MTTVPELELELPAIDQLGVVVEDIEDGMERYTKLLGVGPWIGFDFTAENLQDVRYRGKRVDHDYRLALADVGGLDIELIEPLSEPTLYHDYIEEHGEGIHHAAYYARDRDELRAYADAFEAIDVPAIQSGVYEGTKYIYFDTTEQLNGMMLEIVDRKNIDDRDPAFRYPPVE